MTESTPPENRVTEDERITSQRPPPMPTDKPPSSAPVGDGATLTFAKRQRISDFEHATYADLDAFAASLNMARLEDKREVLGRIKDLELKIDALAATDFGRLIAKLTEYADTLSLVKEEQVAAAKDIKDAALLLEAARIKLTANGNAHHGE